MNIDKWDNSYADVVLKAGVNLQKNQSLFIGCNISSYHFTRVLALKAYELSVLYVDIDITDNQILKARISNQNEEQELKYFPTYKLTRSHQMVCEN